MSELGGIDRSGVAGARDMTATGRISSSTEFPIAEPWVTNALAPIH